MGDAAVATAADGFSVSCDFGIVADDDAFDAALFAQGFVREHQPMGLRCSWHHPDHPRYGVELVSGSLFDGRASRDRAIRLDQRADDELVRTSWEDLIADRLGQHAAAGPAGKRMLDRTQMVLDIAEPIDMGYLSRRIVEQTGDISLLDFSRREGRSCASTCRPTSSGCGRARPSSASTTRP